MTHTTTTTVARELPLEAGGTVEITLSSGDVRVRGTAGDRVVVRSAGSAPASDIHEGVRESLTALGITAEAGTAARQQQQRYEMVGVSKRPTHVRDNFGCACRFLM